MKLNKIPATAIYIVGCLCVIYFAMFALIGGGHVANPDAMIPYTDFERGTITAIPFVVYVIFITILMFWGTLDATGLQ